LEPRAALRPHLHTENEFEACNEAGQNVLRPAGGQANDLVNWSADTVTVVPGMEARYRHGGHQPDCPRCHAPLEPHDGQVANARIWAGFHYRTSTRVGTAVGRRIGEYVVTNTMQTLVKSSP
jgi:hypothetical protein